MNEPASRMHALRVHSQDSPEIRYEEMPIPEPGIGDVLIEVAAASFTPTELDWPSTWIDRAGRNRTPAVPAHEVSGTVRALGYGTTGLAIGDEVYGITDWYRDGAAAELVAVEARNLAPKPASISHPDAAALSLAGLTAWQGLFVHGHLQPKQTVVITGASGGVGSLAVQLARRAGAHVIAVAHDWARPLLDELGADQFVEARDIKASDIDQADLLFDLVGGDLLARCSSLLPEDSPVISVVGIEPELTRRAAGLFFVVEPDRSQLIELADYVATGRLRPVVAKVVPLADGAAEGFAGKHGGGLPGKVVLQPERQ